MDILGLFNYWVVIVLMMIGFYIVICSNNLIKKLICLTIFQTSVFIMYISMGKIIGGTKCRHCYFWGLGKLFAFFTKTRIGFHAMFRDIKSLELFFWLNTNTTCN